MTPTSWTFKMSATRSSATVAGLTSGAKMRARVRAIGASNSIGLWSGPATKAVPEGGLTPAPRRVQRDYSAVFPAAHWNLVSWLVAYSQPIGSILSVEVGFSVQCW